MSTTPLIQSDSMAPNRGSLQQQQQQHAADVASMRYEKNRLSTFASWPLDAPVPKERLAKAGFYFKSSPFRVECFSCGGTVDSWQFNEQAMLKHRSLFPQCAFVTHRSDNVPQLESSGGGGSPVPAPQPADSGYNSSQSPASSQGSSQASTSPRTGFRFPAVATEPATGAPTTGGGGGGGGGPRTWQSFAFLKRERQRLRTFVDWPLDFIQPVELAAAGFFYLRERDKAQCIFCRGIIGEWELGDVPMTEHSRHFPQCTFVLGRNCGNVPADADFESDEDESSGDEPASFHGFDEIGHRLDYRTRSTPESGLRVPLTSTHLNVVTPQGTEQPADLEQLGISEHHAPHHPSYATVESRLRSYQFWPPALAQKPLQLSEAGFFYAGVSDHVKCFHCDGGLRNWVPGDDPWTEHARWFSRCGFIRLVKGDDFIQTVMRDHPQEQVQQVQGAAVTGAGPETGVKRCPFSDEEVENMMENAICKTAVELGVDREAVKRVLKQRLESTGLPFTDLSSVLAMAMEQTQATYLPPGSNSAPPAEAGPSGGHSRVGSTLSAASSGGDSGMAEDARSQDGDMEVQSEGEDVPPSDVHMTSQVSQESTQSTLTNGSSSSGSGNNTPKVLSPAAATTPVATVSSSQSSHSLEEEYQRLKEQKVCKVCMDEEVGVVFLPCGHLITCVNCAPALRDCPLCRTPIRGTVRTYLS